MRRRLSLHLLRCAVRGLTTRSNEPSIRFRVGLRVGRSTAHSAAVRPRSLWTKNRSECSSIRRRDLSVSISLIPCRASGYGDAVDVERAADLYAQCRTLGEVGAELGVHWSTVSQQLQSAGIAMRSGTPPAHPASTKQIPELRDQGLTDTERTAQRDVSSHGQANVVYG